MATPQPASPQPDTGLPPGVEVGALGQRFVAYLIDSLVPAILGSVLGLVVPNASSGLQVILSIVFAVAILGWIVFVLQGIAVRAASPGMRVMKLQLVGFYDGRPIGWARALIRYVLFGLISGTGIVLIVMLVLMVMHPRRQGWHDLVAQAVMIKERSLPPAPAQDQASLSAQPDYGSGQPTGTPPAGSYAAPNYAGGPPLTPPVQSPVAGSPQPPPSYGPQLRYPQAPEQGSSRPPASAPSPRPVPSEPSRAPAAAPAQPAPASPAAASPGASRDATNPGWLAVLDDGREISVTGLVLLGRNPQPEPGEEDAQLIKIADETRTVSKSHLAIGLDAAGLFVVDRGSTNGSTVTTPAGISTRCQPSQVIYVEPSSIVSIGDHWLEIRRS